MARTRFPSDDQRLKTRPHTKIHHTTRTHRKTAGDWHRPEFRGQFLGLMQVAVMANAARNDGRVYLGRQDIEFISGRHRHDFALKSVQSLADKLEYPHECHGDVLVIDIPKLAQKQGFYSARCGATPRTPPDSVASESESEADSPLTPPKGDGAEDGFKKEDTRTHLTADRDGCAGPKRLRDLTDCEQVWAREMATGKDVRWIEKREGLQAGELDRLAHVVGTIRSRLERGLPA